MTKAHIEKLLLDTEIAEAALQHLKREEGDNGAVAYRADRAAEAMRDASSELRSLLEQM